jgi:hypothetical protein
MRLNGIVHTAAGRVFCHSSGGRSASPPWRWKPPTADVADKAALDAMVAALDDEKEDNARLARLAYVRGLEDAFPCVRGRSLSGEFLAALDDMNYSHLTRHPVRPQHVGRLNERLQAVAHVAVTRDEVECAMELFRSYEKY